MTEPTPPLKPPEDPFKHLQGTIPLAPDPDPERPSPAPVPLAEDRNDPCPNCGATMSAGDLLCLKCGYDTRRGQVVRPEVGMVEVPEKKELPEYVTPGRGSPRAVAIIGAVFTLLAMIAAGVNAPASGFAVVAALVALVVFQTVLRTGTGVLAVWIAARLAHERFTRFDLAGARMFACVAVFQFVAHLALPIEQRWLSQSAMLVLACGAYWIALFFLFRKDHKATSVLMVCHVAVALFVEFGVMMAAFLQAVSTPVK